MSYTAPVHDILFTLRHIAGLDDERRPGVPDAGSVAALLEEAGAFAAGRLAPLDRSGDREGARRMEDGAVRMPEGFAAAYAEWIEGGWNAAGAPEAWGGAGLPATVGTALMEIWTSANMAFTLCPVLTQGAVEALMAHGSRALQDAYMPKLVSGEWTATMNLTEPQAGSDLALLTTRAEPAADGTYRLRGQKIFITYGEHDLADNIVHLVLARLPNAPPGTRGISLFLVPKRLPDGRRNDVRCAGIEHKLGIHASPTCTMSYGEQDGAVGWLIGEPHQGLACMFTMMNQARLLTGLQGVAVAERAMQQAREYAADRKQGRDRDGRLAPIAAHPDVQRMLRLMQALTSAGRAIAYVTAAAIDDAHAAPSGATAARAALLTPVTKAVVGEIGFEVASLNVQVHGGMGYVEETGAAQLLRDARIIPIYEGTNGIQAVDFVTRKVLRDGGEAIRAEIACLRAEAENAMAANTPHLSGLGRRLSDALGDMEQAVAWVLAPGRDQGEQLAVATPFLALFGTVAGAGYLTRGASAALRHADDPAAPAAVAAARFYSTHVLPRAGGLTRTVLQGADAVLT